MTGPGRYRGEMRASPVVKVLTAWLLGLALVGAGFLTAVAQVNARLYNPEHQVGLYLDALRDGDGGRALGLLRASVPEGSDPALLDGEALRRAVGPLAEVDVAQAREVGDDRVEVPVTYSLEGTESTTVFGLHRTGAEWWFFPVWEFEPADLPTVEVNAPHSTWATVNGVDVGLPDGTAGLASFYPAEVTAGYTGHFTASPEQSAVVVDTVPPAPLDLLPEATPELTRAVDDQVHAFLDECASRQVFQPGNCPFAYPTQERLAGDIRWSISEYPEVTVLPEDDGWSLAPLEGTARIDTRLQDYFSGAVRTVSDTVPLEFEATLEVSEDAVVVTPVVTY